MLRVKNIFIFFAVVCIPAIHTFAYDPPLQNSQDHIFSNGEVIHVSVLNEDDLTQNYTIDDAGKILMPLIGKVHVSGLSASEIEIFLKTYLQNGYIWDPVVSVHAVQKKGIYVMGEVKSPGHYPLPENDVNILKAVAIAGGFTPDANTSQFQIRRQTEGGNIYTNSNSVESPLFSGDLLIVNKRGF